MDEASNSQPKNESLCKVCGDKASGKHYGVPSCDGCRGFFKRSIRRNLEYVCKENGRCVVDVTRRNQCQACRFKKCLQVNMKRDAVQHERAPRSIQSGFHHHHHYGLNFTSKLRGIPGSNFFSPLQIHSSAILEPSAPIVPAQYLHQSLVFPSMLGAYPKHTLFANNLNTANISYLQSTYAHHHGGTQVGSSPLCTRQNSNRINIKEDEVTSSEEAKNNMRESTLEPNSRLELPTIGESTTKSVVRSTDATCMSTYSIENIYESAAKLLFLALKWAKTIPSFLQLSCRDQSILLEESWNELFILTAAQWDLPIDENFLVSNVSTQTSRNEFLEEDARKLRDIINRLNLLRVDHTEHACLKALVLFKSESRGLCEPVHVELLQDQTHVMLHEYCIQKAGAHKGRFGKLLLSLPAVQAVSKKGLEELLFKQTVGDVSVDRILTEIAKIPPISAINQHN